MNRNPLEKRTLAPHARGAALVAAVLALAAAPAAPAALTSTTTRQGADEIVAFTAGNGTWTPPLGVTTVQVLVVGGGGGGGANGGGGGGAGGLIYSSTFDVSGGDQAVTVGSGGLGSSSGGTAGTAGTNSVFGSLTAVAGGYGASRDGGNTPGAGGSGGGGAGATAQTRTIAGAGTSGQGNSGGNGVWPDQGVNSAAGGGGGAGAAGVAGAFRRGGNGGIGLSYSISGVAAYYAGGGGGGKVVNGLGGSGGLGGGGNAGVAGTANTGGGGGGGGGTGGAGGSGVVIVRYAYGTAATTFSWINAASSTWSPAANWNDGTADGRSWLVSAGQTDYTLNFNTAGTYTATNDLGSGFLLNQLNFGGSTVTLAGNSLKLSSNGATLPQINQNSAAAVRVGNNLYLDADTTIGCSGTGTVTLAGVITGTGGLAKTGSGTLALTGNIAYGGTTAVNGGTLQFAPQAIGTASYATANSFAFTAASDNLLAGLSPSANTNGSGGAEGSAAVTVLTNGLNPTANTSNSLADGYTIGNNAVLTYTLPAGAANGYDISQINIYAGWGDSGRENITLASISYSTVDDPTTFTAISGSAVNYEGGTANALAALTANGGVLGSRVYAVRFNFGTQENNYVGYRELEVVGSPTQVPVSSAISIAAGATLDVSGIAAYTLSSGASLVASGTGTTTGTDAAAFIGAAGGTIDLGLRPITFNFTPATYSGDTAHPVMVVTQGTLTLNGPVTVHIGGSTPLGAGTYRLVSQASGSISGAPTLAGTTGPGVNNGLASGMSAAIQVSGGDVNLVVASGIITSSVTLARHLGTNSITTYGDSLSFDVTVTPTSATGLVTLKDGDTTIGTHDLVAGDNGACTITPALNALAAGDHANIVAVYAGGGSVTSGVSAALSTQSVLQKELTIAGAAAAPKIYDGNTTATLTGTLDGVLAGDTVTLNLDGDFASAVAGVQNVISTSTIGGASQGNYFLTQPDGVTAEILAAGIWTGAGNGHWSQTGNTDNWLYGLTAGDWQSVAFDANTVNGNVTLDWFKGTGLVSLNSGLTQDITFQTGAENALIQNGTGITIAADSKDLTLDNGEYALFGGVTWNIGDGRTLTANCPVTFGGGITMNGPGTAVLNGASTYGGVTNINAGTLVAANNTALGAGGFNAGTMTYVRDGGTLALQGGITVGEHFHIAGSGVGGLGAIRSISGNNALTTNFTMDANATIGVDAGSLTVGSIIYDNGGYGITKAGVGTLTLTAVNSYTGPTLIDGGTLKLAYRNDPVAVNDPSFENGTGVAANDNLRAMDGGGAASNTPWTPSGSGWTFQNHAGLFNGNGGGFNFAAAPPDGAQAAVLQRWENLVPMASQTISFPRAGIYTVSLKACWAVGGSAVTTLYFGTTSGIGGTNVGSFTPSSNVVWNTYGISFYVAAPGSYELTFKTAAGADNRVTGIDQVVVTGADNGALSADSALSIAAGATFDVSEISAYTLGSGASLAASGTGTTPGTDAAVIAGATGGTVSLGSRPVSLVWSGASSGTDNTHPALLVSQATLSLGGNAFTVDVPGGALNPGVYTLVSATSSITGTVNPTPAFTGSGLASGLAGVVSISGNDVILTVATATGYASWATDQGLTGVAGSETDPAFDADPNKDGVKNGLAWILGAGGLGDPAANLLKLPAASLDGTGALVLTFDRLAASAASAPLVVQYGDDLGGTPWAGFTVATAGGTTSDGNISIGVAPGAGLAGAGYDRITVTIPATYLAAHPKTFARLMAAQTP